MNVKNFLSLPKLLASPVKGPQVTGLDSLCHMSWGEIGLNGPMLADSCPLWTEIGASRSWWRSPAAATGNCNPAVHPVLFPAATMTWGATVDTLSRGFVTLKGPWEAGQVVRTSQDRMRLHHHHTLSFTTCCQW